jgi:transcriptional regulator with XRE-family HTH domain
MELAKQLDARMKAKNISILMLEKKAGLKTHAVRNILRGKAKRPGAYNLQAIADVLNCSVKDLLSTSESVHKRDWFEELHITLQKKYLKTPNLKLMPDVIKIIEGLLLEKKKDITVDQFLTCIREIYLHSLQRNNSEVDHKFAEWFIELFSTDL